MIFAGTSCSSVARTSKGDAFAARYADFTYCGVDAVKQSNQTSCGAASLAAVMSYWGKSTSEQKILTASPPTEATGYNLGELRDHAAKSGFHAFVIGSEEGQAAATKLRDHLGKGRPVIVAWECPFGRYFQKLPVVESLDSRTISPLRGWQGVLKKHFVVVIGFSDDLQRWLVMDPAYGIVSVDRGDFVTFWRGGSFAMLLIAP
ncbi:C39 family peptidase [Sulfuriroseicoccus oceanibius]|uniref:C39 family peptidase n=1 Tax=Sulfuriroseicoccus oceanibius TaxID=2707525 RepID=A0A6B3L5U8_9BACT|nr:C39 family peptidase [Sulfuriroseicoccus oceanibius]QQL45776.1 C39 family peptidase [Sulfuriroseicoccus oceanibius]